LNDLFEKNYVIEDMIEIVKSIAHDYECGIGRTKDEKVCEMRVSVVLQGVGSFNKISYTPSKTTHSDFHPEFVSSSYQFAVYFNFFIFSNNCFIVSSLLCVNPNGDFVKGWKYTGTSSSL